MPSTKRQITKCSRKAK